MARDVAAEMRALIDAEKAKGEYNARDLARKIVEHLSTQDPDLLVGWLLLKGEELLWDFIREIDRRDRSHAQSTAARLAAGEAIRDFERGNTGALKGWLETFYVADANNTRKILGDMRAPDLKFVIDRYDNRARLESRKANFFKGVQMRIGQDRVRDHFTEEELARLWEDYKSL